MVPHSGNGPWPFDDRESSDERHHSRVDQDTLELDVVDSEAACSSNVGMPGLERSSEVARATVVAMVQSGTTPLPGFVRDLLWDVDPAEMSAERHALRIFERVMSRGTLDAMRWLIATYDRERLAAFVASRGATVLTARDRAFWSLVLGVEPIPGAALREARGGRPGWAE